MRCEVRLLFFFSFFPLSDTKTSTTRCSPFAPTLLEACSTWPDAPSEPAWLASATQVWHSCRCHFLWRSTYCWNPRGYYTDDRLKDPFVSRLLTIESKHSASWSWYWQACLFIFWLIIPTEDFVWNTQEILPWQYGKKIICNLSLHHMTTGRKNENICWLGHTEAPSIHKTVFHTVFLIRWGTEHQVNTISLSITVLAHIPLAASLNASSRVNALMTPPYLLNKHSTKPSTTSAGYSSRLHMKPCILTTFIQ